jgi:hypothetical protein
VRAAKALEIVAVLASDCAKDTAKRTESERDCEADGEMISVEAPHPSRLRCWSELEAYGGIFC